jgi:hypothetical protein
MKTKEVKQILKKKTGSTLFISPKITYFFFKAQNKYTVCD